MKNQTIQEAWEDAYHQFVQDCLGDNKAPIHQLRKDQSFIISEYRPDYDTWFGKDWFHDNDSNSVSLLDSLDNAMITQFYKLEAENCVLFEDWAERNFPRRFLFGYSSCDSEFDDEDTQAAYDVWRKINLVPRKNEEESQ